MPLYRNPHASLRVGQILQANLAKSEVSHSDLAHRLGVTDTKIIYFVTGRHYFPVEFARPTAETLGIAWGEFTYSILLQYFPKPEVDAIWEAIAKHTLDHQEPSESGANDGGQIEPDKKRKKRKNLASTAARRSQDKAFNFHDTDER